MRREENQIGIFGQPSKAAADLLSGFEEFWSAYPKKRAKGEARKAWEQMAKARPAVDDVVAKVERMKLSRDWTREGGQFIPNPATWLRAEGWDDDPGPATTTDDAMSYDEKYRRMSERGLR